jgi:hypothetical protein
MPPPAARGMPSKPVRATPVIVSVTGVLGPTPVGVDVNGVPAAWQPRDRVGPLSVVDGRLPQVKMTSGWTSRLALQTGSPDAVALLTG